jgi:hypothetical protein
MEPDTDYLEKNRDAKRIRRRVRLSFLALLACIAMMANLISQANAHEVTDTRTMTTGESVMFGRQND